MLLRLADQTAFDALLAAPCAAVIGFVPQFEEEISQYAALATAVGAVFPQVSFALADGSDERLARLFGLAAPCALVIIRERVVLHFEFGMPAAARLTESLRAALARDMQRVRMELAAEGAMRAALAVHRALPQARSRPMGLQFSLPATGTAPRRTGNRA
jgi:hypothetical protein